MYIYENAEVNMSDHNLVRAWFNLGRGEMIKWKKTKYEKRTWYKKDTQSLEKMEEDLMSTLGRKISFYLLIRKIETSQNKTLKVEERMKIGTNRERSIVVAEWLTENYKQV